jgi:hypothetical protein
MLQITQAPNAPVQVKQQFTITGTAETSNAGRKLKLIVDDQYEADGPVVLIDGTWRVDFLFQQVGNRKLTIAIDNESASVTIQVVLAAPPPPRPPRLRFTNVPASVPTEQVILLQGEADNYVNGAQLVLRADRKYELARPRVQDGRWSAPVLLHQAGKRLIQILGSEQDWAEITLDIHANPVTVQVLPRSTWTSDPTPSTLPSLIPQRITLHHTFISPTLSTSATQAEEVQRMRDIYRSHVQGNGWSDIGYHYIVMPSGRIYSARSETKRGAHDVVNDGIGIAFDGVFSTATISTQQYQSAVSLCTSLCQRFNIKDPVTPVATPTADFGTRNLPRILGHRDRVSTECPGAPGGTTVRLEDIRQAVKKQLG